MKTLTKILLMGIAAAHPIPATVTYVIDGDTIVVGTSVGYVHVRLAGIDAPEIMHPKCAKELQLGIAAKMYLDRRLPADYQITLVWAHKRDKYERFLAFVMDGDENLNNTLMQHGYAVAYEGVGGKHDWCAE